MLRPTLLSLVAASLLIFLPQVAARDKCPGAVFPTSRSCDCPPGTFKNRSPAQKSSCEPCPIGTSRKAPGAITKYQCLKCFAGTFSDTPGAVRCKRCPPGMSSEPGSCACGKCRPGFELVSSLDCSIFPTTGSPACKACPRNTFSNVETSGRCRLCPMGFVSAFASEKCVKCPADRQNRQCRCPSGTFLNPNKQPACQPCPVGTFSRSGARSCTPCPVGTFSNVIKATGCKRCPGGTMTSGTGAAACKNPILGCPFDTFRDESGQCKACDPGERLDVRKKKCVSCGKNQVSSGGVITSCTRCAPGKVPYVGMEGFEFNRPRAVCWCAPGSIDSGNGRCRLCPAGTSWELTGKEVGLFQTPYARCIPCFRDTFARRPGSTECTVCPVNFRQLLRGQKGCNRCPRGSRSQLIEYVGDFNEYYDRQCVDEDTGCIGGLGLKRNEGMFNGNCFQPRCKAGSKAELCRKCSTQERYVPSAKVCKLCPDNALSKGGLSTKCNPCPKNSFVDGSDTLILRCSCSIGFGKVGAKCVRCPAGTLSVEDATGQKICRKCAPGTFSSKAGQEIPLSTSCFPCPTNTIALQAGSTACTPCPNGSRTYNDVFGLQLNFCRSKNPYK